MRLLVSIFCVFATAGPLVPSVPLRAADPLEFRRIAIPTLGGKQFWADELFFHQWRIQRNVVDGHCRLLDAKNFRHASGTFEECRARLEQIRRQRNLPPMKGKAVIVLHGLFRTRSSMAELCDYLQQQGGYTVFNVAYPSTRRDVGGHARSLARIVENLEGIEEIDFVAHSMGNIVVRHYLADQVRQRSPSEEAPTASARPVDPRIKRFVMLGPPNHGSLLALTLAENSVLEAITGDTVRQLGQDWTKLQAQLATPDCEFGIIAGGKGDGKGFNPLLPGDDDGTVTVASARLAQAADFVLVPAFHSSIMDNQHVREYTLRFLQKGYFISPEKRQPIGN
ncbi:MAG TPA: hypothetical protein VMY42_11030 [Thermoguttaceae bacterium]|nr:hypothetical protein [Thermoguttaceae bacterium]